MFVSARLRSGRVVRARSIESLLTKIDPQRIKQLLIYENANSILVFEGDELMKALEIFNIIPPGESFNFSQEHNNREGGGLGDKK